MTNKKEEGDLIRQRGSYKGRLTTFSTYLQSLSDSSLTSVAARELQLRVNKMDDIFTQFDQVQLRLECLVEDPSAQQTEREDFESTYYRLISQARELLAAFARNSDDNENGKSSRSDHLKLVKLPTIQLPKFSGSYENWLEFRDTFSSLIDLNDDIASINKFHYLRASLEGSAAVVIQSIEFSSSNYDIAWKLLCDRYDNKRLLVQNHVTALLSIETITKESSVILKRLIDQINKNLRALELLGEPVQHWDTLLIHIITRKLDSKTFREWEEHKGNINKDSSINFDIFITFLRNRADLIETLELSRNTATSHTPPSTKVNPKIKTLISVQNKGQNDKKLTNTPSQPCPKCDGEHNLSNCSQFLALSNNDRLLLLPNYKLCYNCFRTGHYANHCKKLGCKICRRKHNTLIHVADFKDKPVLNPEPVNSDENSQASTSSNRANANVTLSASVVSSPNCRTQNNEVLLSTALIKLHDVHNREYIARALLDSGSTSCLMTEQLFQRLGLSFTETNKSVLGINNITSHINKMCRVFMTSLNDNFSSNLQCFVLPSITDNIPHRQINLSYLNIPTDVCLADPNFHTPAPVDLIIGADVFWDILGTQRLTLGKDKPILYETRLGWIVSGPINGGQLGSPIKCNFTKLYDDIQNQLTRFWQLEEASAQSSQYFPDERFCEEHFIQNTTRDKDGRFSVGIPLKQNHNVLGNSFQRAKHCFLSLERRLHKQRDLKNMYTDFMTEYETLGHMTESHDFNPERDSYFIPHHGVLREGSSTTKLRVVFNASSPTTSGVSYNDIQMVGPTVQDDLLSILLRFRMYKYVLAADVEKMYRQVLVKPEYRHLQQILWRSDSSEELKVYQLNTVTYGTASAPFLATRCLKEVGLTCDDQKVANVIIHDFYVDDLLTGGNNLNEVIAIRERVTSALASACMPLRKWKSNSPELMTECAQSSVDLNIGENEPSKTLGLSWQMNSDKLCFPTGETICNKNSKRDMLSVIARIFDPLGLLSPCIINMKLLLQRLWLVKLSWDEQLTPDICKAWEEILNSLSGLNSLRVSRIVVCDSYQSLELHIFTDASERAYGACLYVRSVNNKGEVLVRLLCAKSRVAPIKPTTIPRLELCGALLGARLYERVANSLRTPIEHTTFWSDSTIVLGWLKMLPNKLQPFVRNRVAEILEKTGNCFWRHVPTNQNPADLISRGVSINTILSLDLWWSGPGYLCQDKTRWPSDVKSVESLPELQPIVSLHASEHPKPIKFPINFNRFSNLVRLKRAVAYALRFINLCRKKPLTTTYLGNDELNNALNLIIKTSQRESFPEYQSLLDKKSLPKNSPLLKLNVFLDNNNIMRVGGRLENSNYPFEKKHPVLLQSTHTVTKLLFKFEHQRLMHAGPQSLLASIREHYWPIGGRNLAKACYHQCVRCERMKGRVVAPIMGNLPQQRLCSGGYPFESVGIDYAGPISSVSRQGRGCRIVKVYILIVICFTTKAIHVELVGDLTSNHFLLALRRFMSRRGKPTNIYSDNGTSFVGAYNELSSFLKANCSSLSESLANEGINFHFIPAYSPHFGGLWEAGVKSIKHHLQRVLGNCKLNYEELYTTLAQIEAILNSRPLTPLSSEPEDLMPLTPGHFLIGRPLTSLPTRDYQERPYDHLKRHQRIEQLRQHFWTRWSTEYITELQQRTKWRSNNNPLQLNSLVVVKEDNQPPLKWKLGRIVAVHPGRDGISRVADIKTASGVIRRSFARICPLPVCDSSG